MQERFGPSASCAAAFPMQQVSHRPEVLAGVMKVQEENGLAEPILGDVPEPDGSVDHDVNFTGPPQPSPPRRRLHRRAKVHGRGVRWAGHHIFLNQHPAARSLLDALLQPVNYRRFDFFPIHAIR